MLPSWVVPRLDVNLSILFTDLPLLDRPGAAAAMGFRAIELWWPFATPVPPPAEVDRLVDSIGGAGLTLACLNFDAGDFAAGQRGLLADPALRSRFRDNVPVAVEIARRLDCHILNALYGNVADAAAGHSVWDEVAVANLAFAADAAKLVRAHVVLEALNPIEYPAYRLHSIESAAALAARVLADTGQEIGLLLDVYHAVRAGHEVAAEIRRFGPQLAHVQVADSPGRQRPGTGSIDFAAVFAALEAASYRGRIGLEYLPSPDPQDSFAWLGLDFGGE